jgi:hypothetical protein
LLNKVITDTVSLVNQFPRFKENSMTTKWMSLLVSLLLYLPAVAQVKLSDCTPRWVTIPAPSAALQFGTEITEYQISNHQYKYPFTYPSPAGVFDVSNAVVDKLQRVGAWSQPKRLTLQSGWRLYAGAWNQPPASDDVGIVWKVKTISLVTPDPLGAFVADQELVFIDTAELSSPSFRSTVPYSSAGPELKYIFNDNQFSFDLNKLRMGGKNTLVSAPPIVVASQFPNQPTEFAYAVVTHTGQTALSPSLQFTPPTPPQGWVASQTCSLQLSINTPFMQGSLGYYMYAKINGGAWQRLPAPHCYGDPAGPNDWIWQLDNLQPTVTRIVPGAPTHVATVPAESYLCNLQVALKDTAGNVIVDVTDVTTYSPVIDEWGTNGDDLPRKFRRKITTPEGGTWNLNQAVTIPWVGGNNQTTYWPMLLVYNAYSQWIGANIQSTWGSACLAFADYQGGKAFGNRFIDCVFSASYTATGITHGVRVRADCTPRYGGHTASELEFLNCTMNADIAMQLSGIQTANVRTNRLHASGGASWGRRNCVFRIDTPNQVRFLNGLFCDCSSNIIFSLGTSDVIIDDMWVDQGFKSMVDIDSGESASFSIKSGGKINAFSNPGERPNLTRIFNNRFACKLLFRDVVTQFNNATELDVTAPKTNMTDLQFSNTIMSNQTVLREATRDQMLAEAKKVYGGAYVVTDWPVTTVPGMNITVPASSVTIPAQSVTSSMKDVATSKVTTVNTVVPAKTIIVPSQTIILNSLTGKQTVKRLSWLTGLEIVN